MSEGGSSKRTHLRPPLPGSSVGLLAPPHGRADGELEAPAEATPADGIIHSNTINIFEVKSLFRGKHLTYVITYNKLKCMIIFM